MTSRALLLTLVCVLCAARPIGAAEQDWTFLPIEDIGARTFRAAHPEYDGRGVIVAVLDTGVDMTIPGLLAVPQGGPKVIDVRDFTGQGDVDLQKAEWSEEREGVLKVADGLELEGLGALRLQPVDPKKVWTGVFAESRFLNSGGVQDLDDDGSTGDRWGIVVFAADRAEVEDVLGPGAGVTMRRQWGETAVETEDELAARATEWICVIDRDRDGHLEDEDLLRDYATDFDHFTLRREASEDARDVLGIALDLSGDDAPKLTLHHDDGGHGSHVAGIAAGFQVHGQDGLDGVAPGAWVVSCKLGDNSLSGGATVTESMKKAYEYVGHLDDAYDVPIVVNMSYGIGSEIEGDASMEAWLDDWLDEHSDVVVCHSAGNSGPGLSNVGLPAGADGVIASAALLSAEAARDLYGGAFAKDELYGFSSRGGELAKPDVASPGGASSTVPLWGTRDRYNGTSMASPHTAGAAACILSGLVQTGRDWNFGTIKRALIATGKDLPGYTAVDVGGGVVDLPAAFEAAKAYADAGEAGQVTIYTVRTEAPGQPDGEAPAAYWRSGGWFPTAPEQQAFSITPRFAKEMDADARNKFYRAFRLSSDVDWIRIDRRDTYMNGPGARVVNLSYDAKKLRESGLHVGTVTATAKGAGRRGAAAHEFELRVTIVVPETFGADDELEWKGQQLTPGAFARRFVRVPAEATALTVEYSIPEGKKGDVRMVLHDPDGRRHIRGGFVAHDDTRERSYVVSGDDLVPGIWEIDTRAAFDTDVRSTYDLSARIDGLRASPSEITTLDFTAPGADPKVTLEVTPVFDQPFRGHAEGEIDHWRRERTVEVEGSEWTYSFEVDEKIAAVEFTIDTDPATYSKFTDCAVNIVDASGAFVVQSGLGQKSDTVRLNHPEPGRYTLAVEGGFALAEDAESWSFDLVERFELARGVHLSGTVNGDRTFRLVPDVTAEVEFEASGVPLTAPTGFVNAGEVRLVEEGSGLVRLRVPLRVKD